MLAACLCLLAAQDPAGSGLEVTYGNGVEFRTKDGLFEGYLSGRLRLQGRAVLDRPDDDAPPLRSVPDSIFIRQARLETGGTFRKEWGYRLQFDWATGTFDPSTGETPSSGSTRLRDAWVEWKRYPEFTVRLGQFYVPGSPEDMVPSRYFEFIERSAMNRLAPGREVGLEVYGHLFDERLGYYLMVSQGQAFLNDQGRSVADFNDEKELAGLVYARPHPNVRLALGGTITNVDDFPASGAEEGEFDLVTTELSVLWLDATGGVFDGRRWRLDASLLAWAGPFVLRAEVLRRRDELQDGGPEDAITATGGFVAASILLTGDEKTPDRPVATGGASGALEVGARLARVRLENVFDAGVASPAGNAERVTAVTVDAGWWVAKNLRLQVEAVHERYGDRLDFDTRREDSLTGFLARIQLEF